jgi:hypothetical protein
LRLGLRLGAGRRFGFGLGLRLRARSRFGFGLGLRLRQAPLGGQRRGGCLRNGTSCGSSFVSGRGRLSDGLTCAYFRDRCGVALGRRFGDRPRHGLTSGLAEPLGVCTRVDRRLPSLVRLALGLQRSRSCGLGIGS